MSSRRIHDTTSPLSPHQPKPSPLHSPLNGNRLRSPFCYDLDIVQQPQEAAECGSSSLSRLPLALPLIVQISIRDASGNVIVLNDESPRPVSHKPQPGGSDNTGFDILPSSFWQFESQGTQPPTRHAHTPSIRPPSSSLYATPRTKSVIMTARTRRAEELLLDNRMDILNRNAVDVSPAQQIFRTVSAILALVKDKMIHDGDSMRLSEYCFSMCTTQWMNGGDINGSARAVLRDLERVTYKIERTLRMGTNSPHTNYDKEKVEGYKLEIQQILGTLNAPGTPPDESSMAETTDSADTPITSAVEYAIWRLIKRAFAPSDCSSLIKAAFSSRDGSKMVRGLCKDDAQSFVDVIDEALLDIPDLSSQIRRECLKSLYRTCGRHALLPTAMKVLAQYDRTGGPLCRGGFADVWKGDHCGREVAVKVMRTYTRGDLQKVVGRFCKEVVTWRSLRHPNVLSLIGVMMTEGQFAMISGWMENGNINEFMRANPDANQLGLLEGVARGLIYIHSQGMIHGDLKGANILIDQTGHARLADFGLLTIVSDPANLLSSRSFTQGGTARWMSPELINPQRFGFENSCPTKSSDCYAFGMVIYETISGRLPFHKYTDLTVFVKVLEGERPLREAGFTNSLWEILELCWVPQPDARPRIEDVLHCLEGSSQSGESSSRLHGEVDECNGWDSGSDSSSSEYSKFLYPSLDLSPTAPPPVRSHAHPTPTEGCTWDETYLDVLGAQDLGQLRELLARSDPEVVMPLNSTPPLSQAVILVLVHRLASAISEAPSVDESFGSMLRWLRRAASAVDSSDPLISPYVPRVLPSTQGVLNSTKQRLLDLPGGPQLVHAAGVITDVQEILGRHHPNPAQSPDPNMLDLLPTAPQAPRSVSPQPVQPHTHTAPTEDWDGTYLTVLHTQDLGQLRELLARSVPEVVMPLLSTPPLSQTVILTLVRRLTAAIGEAPSLEENFRGGLWWLRRAALALDPYDPMISPYIPTVLPSTQRTLDSAKQQLMVLPSGQMIDAARTIADVQGILNGEA